MDHIFSPPPWDLKTFQTSLFDIFFDRPGIDFKNCDRCQHSFHTVFEAGVTLFQQIVAGQISRSEGYIPPFVGRKLYWKINLLGISLKNIQHHESDLWKNKACTCVFEREWMCTFPSFCFSPGNGPKKNTQNHVANLTHARCPPSCRSKKKNPEFSATEKRPSQFTENANLGANSRR